MSTTTVQTPAPGAADPDVRVHVHEAPRPTVPGTIREIVVIVAGVLLALGANAWWESTRERAREREYLELLLADTRVNEQHLASVFARDSTNRDQMRAYYAFLLSGAPLPSADSIRRLRTVRYAHFEPVTGAYKALLETGDIRLLRNDELRRAVISYAAALDAAWQSIDLQRQQHWNGLARRNERELLHYPAAGRQDIDPEELGELPLHYDYAALRRDPEYQSATYLTMTVRTNRLTTLRSLREPTQRLRAMLEADLAR